MNPQLALGVITVLMAILGGVVSVHGPTRRGWKIFYLFAFIVLGGLAVAFVIKQSSRSAGAEAHLRNSLQNLRKSTQQVARLSSLNTSLQEQLLRQSHRIARLAERNIGEATGGHSFCYLMFVPIGGNRFLVGAIPRGKYPLHSVNVTLTDLRRFALAMSGERSPLDSVLRPPNAYLRNFTIGDLPSASAHVVRNLGQYAVVPSSDFNGFNVAFSALNGSWTQTTLMRKVGGKWVQATKVFIPSAPASAEGRILYERVDRAYPKKHGQVDWGPAQGHWVPMHPGP